MAGINPAVVAVFARALTTFSQHLQRSANRRQPGHVRRCQLPSTSLPPFSPPVPTSIGTRGRPRSRGGVSVGRYWGQSPGARRTTCRWDGDGWGRCPTTGSYPHPLRLPVCQSEGGVVFFFTDGGPSVAGINPAVVAVFARALTTFSQTVAERVLIPVNRPRKGFRGSNRIYVKTREIADRTFAAPWMLLDGAACVRVRILPC